jgi:hypothetical protein
MPPSKQEFLLIVQLSVAIILAACWLLQWQTDNQALVAQPATLEEVFPHFDRNLIPGERDRYKHFKEEDLCRFGGSALVDALHFKPGFDVDLSKLYKRFDELGVTDYRTKRAILHKSYWLYLNNKPIDFDKQVQESLAYIDNHPLPFVEMNKPLTPEILAYQFQGKDGVKCTIGSLPQKLKVIYFIDNSQLSNTVLIAALKGFKNRYSAQDVAVIVFVFPAKNLVDNSGMQLETKLLSPEAKPFDVIDLPAHGFDNIYVAPATLLLAQSLLRFDLGPNGTVLRLPVAYLVTNGAVKLRVTSINLDGVNSFLAHSSILNSLVSK